MSSRSFLKRVGWLSVLCACTSTAWAHHGGGTFDANRCFVFTGTVKQVAWANPHAWIYVQVEKAGGASELWGFEFGSISGLSRAGYRPADFATGTKVTVTGYANRNPEKHTGSASRLILPDGRDSSGSDIAGTAPAGGPPPGAGGPPGAGYPSGAGAPPGAGGPPPGGRSARSMDCPEYK